MALTRSRISPGAKLWVLLRLPSTTVRINGLISGIQGPATVPRFSISSSSSLADGATDQHFSTARTVGKASCWMGGRFLRSLRLSRGFRSALVTRKAELVHPPARRLARRETCRVRAPRLRARFRLDLSRAAIPLILAFQVLPCPLAESMSVSVPPVIQVRSIYLRTRLRSTQTSADAFLGSTPAVGPLATCED